MGKGDVQNPQAEELIGKKHIDQKQGREGMDNANEAKRSKSDDSYQTDADE